MEQDKTSVDVHKFVRTLLSRKWLWIITTIVISIGAIFYALNQPDIYESKCVLIVDESKLLNTVLVERGVAPETGKILQAI
ncbi:MAG: Wzz/FepE/Etk N-terminal domain-containing protein, partial [Thermodesulfobacteriota bacterium]